jgi:hypothetical protein
LGWPGHTEKRHLRETTGDSILAKEPASQVTLEVAIMTSGAFRDRPTDEGSNLAMSTSTCADQHLGPATEIGRRTRLADEILGAGFAIVGIAVMAFGLYRHRAVALALSRGEDVRVNGKVVRGRVVHSFALLGAGKVGAYRIDLPLVPAGE